VIPFIRDKVIPSRPVQLVIRTGVEWQRDQCLEMGAALSYYALFSIFPIFLVILSIVGFLLGRTDDLIPDILVYAQSALPPSAYDVFEDVLLDLNSSSVGAGITGFFLLFFSASNVFGALDRSVDRIWNVHHKRHERKTFQASVIGIIKDRVVAFSLVLSSAAIMTLSLLADLVFDVIRRLLEEFNSLITFIELDEVMIISKAQLGITFLVMGLIVMALFKILPSDRIPWGDIWPGAFLTAALFMGLQYLVSNSIIHVGAQYRSYGFIGGVMVMMLWIYFTCQIFFLGSEFAYVYAHLYGSRRKQSRDRRQSSDRLEESTLI
jgi:membrane protein